jgi:16S rRNA G966 N2-methylase RsmD
MAAELYVKRAKRRFDFVFCDPPFPYRYKWDLLEKIACSPLMEEGSRLLLHRPREDFHDGELPFLEKTGSKEYGRSVVDSFYFKKNGDFA